MKGFYPRGENGLQSDRIPAWVGEGPEGAGAVAVVVGCVVVVVVGDATGVEVVPTHT